MTLDSLQRSLASACLDADLSDDVVRDLGGARSGWTLYREMVRRRFIDTIGESLPRSREALGPDGLARAVSRWLDRAPPTTRYVRELCLQFSRYLCDDPACLPADAPPWTLDLVRYEAAVMEAVIAEDPPPRSDLVALSMELPVALSTTQRFLRLSWSVHLPEATAERPCAIAVYRGPNDAVEALEFTPVAGDIVEALRSPGRTLGASIRDAIEHHRVEVDARFNESLAGLLGDLIERGLFLGGRRAH
ncbi:MAG: hypothetical protein EPO40_08470 [Myxococcaceae bacterium]|nr:MAG: hypothetical protein EPO40_08470 [Myxococcaceae bacterium]